MRIRLLRHRVRHLLQTDRLPARDSYFIVRPRPASGLPCCCCDQPISTGTEYGPELCDGPGWRFHLQCHAIWKEERLNRAEADAAVTAASASIRTQLPLMAEEAG